MTSSAAPKQIAPARGVSATAMMTAATSTYEASSSRSAAAPTRHGPGR